MRNEFAFDAALAKKHNGIAIDMSAVVSNKDASMVSIFNQVVVRSRSRPPPTYRHRHRHRHRHTHTHTHTPLPTRGGRVCKQQTTESKALYARTRTLKSALA